MSIRKLIQRILNQFGYQIIYVGKGRRAPPDPLSAFFQALCRIGFHPKHMVDIGANRGHWTRTAVRYFPKCHYTLVEPQERFHDRISDLEQAGISLRWVNAGVGDKKDRLTLNIPVCDTSASFLPLMGDSAKGPVNTVEVDVLPLDDILAEDSAPLPDLVKIDAEGLDLRVIDGARSLIGKTEIFMIEAALFDEQFENTLVRTVRKMDALGYVPFDITDINRSANSGVLWLTEIAFVRKTGPLLKAVPSYLASFQPH